MSGDVSKFFNSNGDLEFPKYLYKSLNDLMKHNLDLGILASENPQKLRAYKEMVKQAFKQKWLEIAGQLEEFGMIEPCICNDREFCTICGGSRYLLDEAMFDAEAVSRKRPMSSDEAKVRTKLTEALDTLMDKVN